MNKLYVIATGASVNMSSEHVLWDALKRNGWAVHDIHDLPRITQNEIIVTNAPIARLVQKRVSNDIKPVILICLEASALTMVERLRTYSTAFITAQMEANHDLAMLYADLCVQSDDLNEAAAIITEYIRKTESS